MMDSFDVGGLPTAEERCHELANPMEARNPLVVLLHAMAHVERAAAAEIVAQGFRDGMWLMDLSKAQFYLGMSFWFCFEDQRRDLGVSAKCYERHDGEIHRS